MSKTSRENLKDNFKTGQKPTEENFADIFDSFVHLDDKNNFIQKANQQEAEAGDNNEKYLTPLRAKQLVTILTRLATLPNLSQDIQNKVDTAVNNVVANAPDALNNLRELAEELQKNAGSITDILNKIKTKADKTHNHHTLYYPQSAINAFFEGTRQGKKQVNWSNITNLPSGFTPANASVTDAKISSSGISIDKVKDLRSTLDNRGAETVFFSWREVCHLDNTITTYPDATRSNFVLLKIVPEVFSTFTLYNRQFLIRMQKQRGSSITLRVNLDFVLSRTGRDPTTLASWRNGGSSTTQATQAYKAVSWRVVDVNPAPPDNQTLQSTYIVELWHVQTKDTALSTTLYLFVRWALGGSFTSIEMLNLFPNKINLNNGQALNPTQQMQVLPLGTEYRSVSVNPHNLPYASINKEIRDKMAANLKAMKFFFDVVRRNTMYTKSRKSHEVTHVKEEHPIIFNPKHFTYQYAATRIISSSANYLHVFLILGDQTLGETDTFTYKFQISAKRNGSGSDLRTTGRIWLVNKTYIIEQDRLPNNYYQPSITNYSAISSNVLQHLIIFQNLPRNSQFKHWNISLYREIIHGASDLAEIGVRWTNSSSRSFTKALFSTVISSYS